MRRWEETDDVVSAASLTLLQKTDDGTIKDPIHFLRYSANMIRWTLLDLVARHNGRRSFEANHETVTDNLPEVLGSGSVDASVEHLAVWTQFHTSVDELSDADHKMVDLMWYQGLKVRELQNCSANAIVPFVSDGKRHAYVSAASSMSHSWRT